MTTKTKQEKKMKSAEKKDRFVWTRKHLLGLEDLSKQELVHILDTAEGVKDISDSPPNENCSASGCCPQKTD